MTDVPQDEPLGNVLMPTVAEAPSRIIEDTWQALRVRTDARIALGRAGASLPTREVLAFGLAHAQARDAVHAALDVAALRAELETEGWAVLEARSRAPDRAAYLARPDWGRRLDDAAAMALAAARPTSAPDLVFALCDGLSAVAVQRHALPLLRALRPLLSGRGLVIAPIVVATQARVALADEIGEALGARIAVSLIGERPGLSAADSLGAYLTYAPQRGRSDAERNCISNVRPAGLNYEAAARELAMLIDTAFARRGSGVSLASPPIPPLTPT